MPSPPEQVAQTQSALLGLSLIRPLGSGSHKFVYLVGRGHEYLALKIAPSNPVMHDRLSRESSVLLSCHHPSIAKLETCTFHSDAHGDHWVFVEEYFAGGSLEQRLRLGPMQASEVRTMGMYLARALEHLHDKRVVHRDLKPGNIMFRENGSVALIDFGIVRVLDASSLTMDFIGMGPGTPNYAAPEQLTNQKANIDWRTDQFGLATVLTECLTGHHPFAPVGVSMNSALQHVATHSEVPVETCEQLVAKGFGFLVQALSPWPVSRYRWPKEFIAAFSESPS